MPPGPSTSGWVRRRRAILVAGIAFVLILAGIAFAFARRGGSPLGTGYLATGSSAITFIQWSVNGTRVSGTAMEDDLTGSPPAQSISTTRVSVSGQIQGSKISLSFGGSTDIFGTFNGQSFTIGAPQSDGTLAPATFRSATATQFNSAVAALRRGMDSVNEQAAARQQAEQNAAAAAQKLRATEAAISSASTTVKSDLSDLNATVATMQTSLQKTNNSLTTMKGALANVSVSEQKVQSSAVGGTHSTTCYYASSTVYYEADQTVDYEARQTVTYYADDLKDNVTTVQKAINALQTAFTSFQVAQSTDPSFHPATATSQATITAAVLTAKKAITSDIAQANADISQANTYVTEAFQIVDTAYQVGGCGTPPSAPTPQPSIST